VKSEGRAWDTRSIVAVMERSLSSSAAMHILRALAGDGDHPIETATTGSGARFTWADLDATLDDSMGTGLDVDGTADDDYEDKPYSGPNRRGGDRRRHPRRAMDRSVLISDGD